MTGIYLVKSIARTFRKIFQSVVNSRKFMTQRIEWSEKQIRHQKQRMDALLGNYDAAGSSPAPGTF